MEEQQNAMEDQKKVVQALENRIEEMTIEKRRYLCNFAY